jgi:hypothetical protein
MNADRNQRDKEAMSMSEVMLKLRQIEQDILATGKVDGPELESLRRELYTQDKIERPEADFLVELHKRVQHPTPAFEQFFYQAMKDHILAHGRIDAEEAAWLSSSPTASLRTKSASSCTNSKARPRSLAVSSRPCSQRA